MQKNYNLINTPEFEHSFKGPKESYIGGAPNTEDVSKAQKPMMFDDTARAAAYGAQSGGLSGALTSGGVASMLGAGGMAGGGPYAVAGGLILSQIEAAQKAKAQAEIQRVTDERNRMASAQSMYEKMANQTYEV